MADLDLRNRGTLNFNILADEEWNDELSFTDDDDLPISLTGATITMVIKEAGDIVHTLTVGDGITIDADYDSIVVFEPPVLKKGSYRHTTEIELLTGEQYTLTGLIIADE